MNQYEALPDIESEHKEVIETAQKLEQCKDKEQFKVLIETFLGELENSLSKNLDTNMASSYRQMQEQNLLLRVENLSRVMESIFDNKPIHVGDKEDHYANSVIPSNDGVKIAFAEGQAPGPVRLLIGFDVKTAVSFGQDSLHVYEVDSEEEDLRDAGLRKQVCRHVEGDIEPRFIKHMVLRVPRIIFPEDRMTLEEKNGNAMYVFRVLHLD